MPSPFRENPAGKREVNCLFLCCTELWKRGIPRKFAHFVSFCPIKSVLLNLLCVFDHLYKIKHTLWLEIKRKNRQDSPSVTWYEYLMPSQPPGSCDSPFKTHITVRWKTIGQLAQHRTDTPLTQVRFPGAERDFSPRVNFQCRLSYRVYTPPCAIACIYICAHVKDPKVHVRVWWILETLKHPACTIG